ncbi:GGDEF domain-containing protein [Actinocrispum sp. NPDC049592]|uniref:GGDEF domain-containing protein n=1 Tax=Actinocrispum sp. NPDC049592 TaxID=3154835 RepID=UPI00341C7B1C
MPDNRRRRVRRLADVRPAGVAFFWLVLAGAAGAVVAAACRQPVGWADWGRAAVLAAAAMTHAEAARNVERQRWSKDAVAHVDLNSTWTFAAALVLPLPLTTALIVLIYTHVWLRVHRTPPFQRIFNIAMYVVAATAARTVFYLSGTGPVTDRLATVAGVLSVLAAAACHVTVNILMLTTWLGVARLTDNPLRATLGRPADNAVEIATICLAVFIALAAQANPALVFVGLPLVLLLHRNELVHQLQEVARTDTKTGLLNATAWTDLARDEIGRAPRRGIAVGVLLMDLDLFKKINDTYGHLAGDDVLRHLATTFRAEVRTSDAVGRFGGEEFVVLLPDTTVAQMTTIADRIRQKVETLTVIAGSESTAQRIAGLSVSIGAAAFPVHGQDLDQLMEAADKALYRAKSNGRNQTQLATPLPV